MFRVMRCLKCGHVMAGQDDFVERIMERINQNAKLIERLHGGKQRILIQENALLRTYFKQILHWQNEEYQRRDLNRAKIGAITRYIHEHNLLTNEELEAIYDSAEEHQMKLLEQSSYELKRLYGEFENICNNHTNADPTANAAINKLSKGEKK